MNITKDCVVQFHYSLTDQTGAEIERTHDGDPMAYLHGHNNVIPGLEKAMEGRSAGESFSETIAPADAYGERREGVQQRIPLKHLKGARKWKPGMVAWISTEQGNRQVTVVKVGKFNADCDLNHPLAGKTLTFSVEIVAVREASKEEIQHGHAHGVGGHHH